MENRPFISDFPVKISIHRGFSSKPCLITGWYTVLDLAFMVLHGTRHVTAEPQQAAFTADTEGVDGDVESGTFF